MNMSRRLFGKLALFAGIGGASAAAEFSFTRGAPVEPEPLVAPQITPNSHLLEPIRRAIRVENPDNPDDFVIIEKIVGYRLLPSGRVVAFLS